MINWQELRLDLQCRTRRPVQIFTSSNTAGFGVLYGPVNPQNTLGLDAPYGCQWI